MAISYPLSLPSSPKPRSIKFYARHAVALSRSDYTYQQQVQNHSGDLWGAEVSLPTMKRDDSEKGSAADWIGFFLSLRGQEGTFLLGPEPGATARGVATGTPLVNGANQSGSTLITDGWTTSQTGILKAGDFFSIASRLYMVTQDADSDGSGNATLEIFPQLRESPADDAGITTSSPTGLFRLSSNVTTAYGVGVGASGGSYDLSFSAVEAV